MLLYQLALAVVDAAAPDGALTGVVDLTVYGPIGVLATFALAAAAYMFRTLKLERDAHDNALMGIVEAHREDVTSLSKAHAEDMLALGERHRAEFVTLSEEYRTELQQVQEKHRAEMGAMVDRHISAAAGHVQQYHALSEKMSSVLDALARRVEARRTR